MTDFYDYPAGNGFVDSTFIQAHVEAAGKTIMMLPGAGAWPAGYRSCLPDYVYEFSDLIESPKETSPVPLRASSRQMDDLSMVEDWIVYLAQHCKDRQITHVARAVSMGMLHYPRSGKRFLSFRKMADQMGASHPTVKKWYMDGIGIMQNHYNLQAAGGF